MEPARPPPDLSYIAPAMFRDRFVCQYCGADGLRDVNAYYSLQVDHFVPRAKGGPARLDIALVAVPAERRPPTR